MNIQCHLQGEKLPDVNAFPANLHWRESWLVNSNFRRASRMQGNISARRVFMLQMTWIHYCIIFALEWPQQRSIAICYTCFRTRSTLLSVMSNLSAIARAVSWLAILQRKAKTFFQGRMAAHPDPFLSGILPVGMTAWVNSSQVCLVASRHSKVTLELVRKITGCRALKVVANSI